MLVSLLVRWKKLYPLPNPPRPGHDLKLLTDKNREIIPPTQLLRKLYAMTATIVTLPKNGDRVSPEFIEYFEQTYPTLAELGRDAYSAYKATPDENEFWNGVAEKLGYRLSFEMQLFCRHCQNSHDLFTKPNNGLTDYRLLRAISKVESLIALTIRDLGNMTQKDEFENYGCPETYRQYIETLETCRELLEPVLTTLKKPRNPYWSTPL